MQKLTPKQHGFCLSVASGKTLKDSYKANYDATRMKDAVVRNAASKLAAKSYISETIARLRQEQEQALTVATVSDKDRVLDKLRTMMDSAEPADAVKLRACELLGKTIGLFKEVSLTEDNRDSVTIRKELADLFERYESPQQDDVPVETVTDEEQSLH